MTHMPKYLKEYPNVHTSFPLHLSLNQLPNGYPAHKHDFLEFSYVIDGEGEEVINGTSHPMMAGTFTFIMPYQVHEIRTAPGSLLRLYNCNFSLDLIMDSEIGSRIGGFGQELEKLPAFVQMTGASQLRMLHLLEDMYAEYNSNQRWRETVLKAKLWEVLVQFDRYRQTSERGQITVKSINTRNSVWSIIHYIHHHYQDELKLSDLAQIFAMSPSRISELIKHATGQTFVEIRHDLRIRHAAGLLASTNMSVIAIAFEVGYGSYKTFSRIFREKKGVKPSEYRRFKQS